MKRCETAASSQRNGGATARDSDVPLSRRARGSHTSASRRARLFRDARRPRGDSICAYLGSKISLPLAEAADVWNDARTLKKPVTLGGLKWVAIGVARNSIAGIRRWHGSASPEKRRIAVAGSLSLSLSLALSRSVARPYLSHGTHESALGRVRPNRQWAVLYEHNRRGPPMTYDARNLTPDGKRIVESQQALREQRARERERERERSGRRKQRGRERAGGSKESGSTRDVGDRRRSREPLSVMRSSSASPRRR